MAYLILLLINMFDSILVVSLATAQKLLNSFNMLVMQWNLPHQTHHTRMDLANVHVVLLQKACNSCLAVLLMNPSFGHMLLNIIFIFIMSLFIIPSRLHHILFALERNQTWVFFAHLGALFMLYLHGTALLNWRLIPTLVSSLDTLSPWRMCTTLTSLLAKIKTTQHVSFNEVMHDLTGQKGLQAWLLGMYGGRGSSWMQWGLCWYYQCT